MLSVPWYYYAITILSGGAVGSIITLLVTKYQNRIQPVSKAVRLVRVFGSMSGESSLSTRLVVEKDGSKYDYDNLYVASVNLDNSGNQDYESFQFGVTLPENADVIHVDTFSEDRHHDIKQITDLGLDEPVREVDFKLDPFNRQDSYQFDLHIVLSSERPPSEIISFGSSHPVKFVDNNQAADLALEVGLEVLKRFALVRLR